MGFHICEYCKNETSSGDVTLHYEGRSWVMPDMILHYVAEHYYQPPNEFIADVMSGNFTGGSRVQTKGVARPVGYLNGAYPTWCGTEIPNREEFFLGLWLAMQKAKKDGGRRQTRGIE